MTPTTSRHRFQLTEHTVAKQSKYGRGQFYQARVFADGGAVSQDGAKPVFRCDCGTLVVWTKGKTGRSYLSTCYPYRAGGLYYVKASPHTQEAHDRRMAEHEAFDDFDPGRS